MNNALFGGFVYGRLGLSHQLVFVCGVFAGFFGGTYPFFQAFKGGFDRSVSQPSYLTLFCTFFCRFMVSQLGLAPCISKLKVKPYFKSDNIYVSLGFVKENL